MKNLWLTGGILVLFSTCTSAESIYDQPYLGKLGRPWDRFSARSLEAQAREGLGGVVAAADLIILGTAQGLRELRSGKPPDPDKVEAQEATVRVVRVLKGKTDQKEFKLRWTPSATSIRDGARHVFFLKLRKGADPLVQKAMYLYPKRSNVMRIVGAYGCSEDVGLAVLDHLIHGSRPPGLPKKLLAEYQSSSYGHMYSAAVMAASAKVEIGQEVLKRVIAERRRGRFNFDLFCTAAHALAAKKGDEGLKLLLVNIPVSRGHERMAESVVFDLVAAYGTTKLVPRLVKFARENPRYGVSAAFALAGIGGDQARRGIGTLLADPGVSKRTEVVRDFGTRKVPAADLLRQALSACRADYSKQVAQSGWVWSDEEATPLYCLTQAGQKYDVHLVNPHDKRWALIIRIFNGKRKVHEWLGHHNSVFRILRDRLYYARFNRGSSGGTIVAVDLKTGKHLWSSPLKALGPVRHSSYRNLMNLSVSDKVVVVRGKESLGNYLEYKDAKTGKTLGHKRFGPAPSPGPTGRVRGVIRTKINTVGAGKR